MASLSLMTWRQENNDMNKRLGEVRASEGSQGIWARMARGQSKYGQQGIKNQYQSILSWDLMRGCFLDVKMHLIKSIK